ncbi:HNH endonuclease signature motif containing protein [Corynebacterium imitans]|uniref:HNH endonuclease n=1 Tax=Corynebacterium imitans TaxID=156978 RepID=UPI00254EA9D2|nr:HNH endonuclease signature motif containing protein [Corynebacterium imitans]MDK8305659.1 HNH endonuclease signature motif containing protein [Corynebacterium imitans]MDK8636475.1 HNH endonuclease signature motif containing protein [Corynebacterium imitans]MDK8771851.1 HNH endonuclease signature motif containing protein [Corynebacterium imitans]
MVPRKPKRPCSQPGCPELTDHRFCPAHARAEDERYRTYQRDPAINKRYDHRRRQIRNAYIQAHPLCEQCQTQGRVTPAQEVDHIVPLEDGGTHDEANLQALCKPCHSSKTAGGNDRWRYRRHVYKK